MKNIGYHTRLYADNTRKVVGGSFGGSLDMDTANRLVSSQFTVVVKDSGRAILVDRGGREVTLYISVDVAETERGKEAIKLWLAGREKLETEAERRRKAEASDIDNLMESLDHAEIIRRLKG